MTSAQAPRLPADLITPALVVDLDVMQRNIAAMQAAMTQRGIALRPHTKTHRSVEIARRQVAAGASGITVGTLGEAEVMAAGGIDDIFIAYPVWAGGPNGPRIRALNDAIRLSVGVDSIEGANALGEAVNGSQPLEVLVEIDSGDHRTGAPDPDTAATVATAAQHAGLRVRGLFTHGGHGYRPNGSQQAADDEVTALVAAADALRAAGIEANIRSAGSTPTALLSARDGVTEERPGTYVFGDRQTLHLGAAAAEQMALWVVATVISTSVHGQFVIGCRGQDSLLITRRSARSSADSCARQRISRTAELRSSVAARFDTAGTVRLVTTRHFEDKSKPTAALPSGTGSRGFVRAT